MTRLLLATNNKGKVKELKALLRGTRYELVTPEQVALYTRVEETGTTYEENARLKAVTLSRLSGLITLADDSGLEVDALNGEPGTLSARYAGEKASDEDRVIYLLSRLKDIPQEKRTARFVSVIAIATPDGKVKFSRGECEGVISFAPKGKRGFGYDPVFYFPKLGKTMAELPMALKNQVSHRGKAAKKAKGILLRLKG
ncbi:MAG: XTP/dITP diphosphatase [Chloroflexota bacterium]